VGRVARPGGSSSSGAVTTGSISHISPSGGGRQSSSSSQAAFDPFAASEHGDSTNASKPALHGQRRGKNTDQETLLRKIKKIGISEEVLQNMKQAGLVIIEEKR
jgi:hypothetical protein